MKYQNIVFYSLIPLAFLSLLSVVENVQAQTNATNQTTSQQPSQSMNLTAQALMKIDIVDLKNNLMNAKLAILNGDHEEALTVVRDVETQLLLIKPSPTKFLSDLHKITNAITKSNIDKSLDSLTKVQVDILKAENQLFKTAVTNPQLMEQFNNIEQETEEEEDY
jgi:hypothetical protein